MFVVFTLGVKKTFLNMLENLKTIKEKIDTFDYTIIISFLMVAQKMGKKGEGK